MTNISLPMSPDLILLHNWHGLDVNLNVRNFINLLFCAAVSLIMLHWKSARIPMIQDCFLKLTDYYIQDKVSETILRLENLPPLFTIQVRCPPPFRAVSLGRIDRSWFPYMIQADLFSSI